MLKLFGSLQGRHAKSEMIAISQLIKLIQFGFPCSCFGTWLKFNILNFN